MIDAESLMKMQGNWNSKVIAVLRELNDWKPAYWNGKPVNVRFVYKVIFGTIKSDECCDEMSE